MASFESKVSDIFNENPKLARKLPVVIKKLFHESESDFRNGELQLCDARFRVQNFQSILDIINTCAEFHFVETKIRKDKNKKKNIVRTLGENLKKNF